MNKSTFECVKKAIYKNMQKIAMIKGKADGKPINITTQR